jgi:hypothetical protein
MEGRMSAAAREPEPERPQPILLEDMLALVQFERDRRAILRRTLIEEGALRGPLDDRTQLVWRRIEDLLAKSIVVRRELATLLSQVTIGERDEVLR